MRDKAITILLIFLVASLCGCQQRQLTDKEKIEAFYHENVPEGDFGKFRKVTVINELGTCIVCNRQFAQCQYTNLDDTTNLFIISSVGQNIDIHSYLENPRSNIIWDTMRQFDQLGICDTCCVIALDTLQ